MKTRKINVELCKMMLIILIASIGFATESAYSEQKSISFQEGVDYSGIVDTYIDRRVGESDISQGEKEYWGCGNHGTSGNRQTQPLIRFEHIFGSIPGQIPLGSEILEAKLWLYIYPTDGESDCGAEIYRMLNSWDEDDTWDEWVDGIQPVTEAAVGTPDDYIVDFPDLGAAPDPQSIPQENRWFSLNVTQSLQTWSDGEQNRGWLLQSYNKYGSNGVPFCSSEYPEVSLRPKLQVTFLVTLVKIDIKPEACPNKLNIKDKGVLPVAILGTENFDVFTIDPASIRLAGKAPVRSSYEDVATPVADEAEVCECTTAGPDGYLDLTLKFNVQEIVTALGEVNDGDELELTLTGVLNDGKPIEGKDCIIIISKGKQE